MTRLLLKLMPSVAATAAVVSLALWLGASRASRVDQRVPGADEAPATVATSGAPPQERGRLQAGEGVPADLTGSWPQFRGPDLDGISKESVPLARTWPQGGPPVLWDLELGEGYAGPAVHGGCVYLLDYDREQSADVVRCLSLADGREIWRFSYDVKVKRNHGMSRTVPAVNDNFVVTLGPKCHVTCLDAATGERRWALDLVQQYATEVPEWYAGQCPFFDGDRVIIAPAGKVMMLALDLESGETLWETPNPKDWAMTHASVVPMSIGDQRTYVYPAKRGVVGVAADDGRLLWETTEWKIGIATVPTPVVIDDSRLFLSGGYNAGSLMLEVMRSGEEYQTSPKWRLGPDVFGATQSTPLFYQGHLFGVRPNGEMVCLSLDGNVKWASGADYKFGLGPYMIADGLLLAANDDGLLVAMEATPDSFRPLAQADVLQGHEVWAPMALADGRLLLRDLTRMVCLDLRG